ncbi:hypothetical protein AQJ84_03035 [Streptomyces resistomycificus]|uniref:Endonuclease/exonuclease/phosphatase domain-containing protein n=1 Tax=Streptomyces resistomycificus TaxID=67356 RepID=A0A0L8LXX1_9ACTN|nr:hypothetical protein ADK37_03045 [Streptomyces resistomycificus]KUO01435.1 hypothetical protein AQJ84_03035 [Streptomyces resistomycificus]
MTVMLAVRYGFLCHSPLRIPLTVALAMVALTTSIVAVVFTPQSARADGLDRRTVITWNMQGESLAGQPGAKWEQARQYMRQTSVLLLQEAGAGPPSSMLDDNNERVRSITHTTADGDTYENSTWNPETETHEGGPTRSTSSRRTPTAGRTRVAG